MMDTALGQLMAKKTGLVYSGLLLVAGLWGVETSAPLYEKKKEKNK